jgi:RecA/RadA recombinase
VHEPLEPRKPDQFLSSGCTVLNLAMTDDPDCGWRLGTFNNLVGDSSAGKTLLLMTAFAEANAVKLFKKYELCYDEPEVRNQFASRLFGKGTSERISRKYSSHTIQEWQANCWALVRQKNPFVYGLDSFDAVGSQEERERFEDLMDKMEKGKDVSSTGSYKTDKAKGSGEAIREIVDRLSKTLSLIIILRQTRDNIGVTFGDKKTVSGGNAFRFYSNHEIWLRVVRNLTRKTSLGDSIQVGVLAEAKIKKNNTTGKVRVVKFPLYYDYGVADTEALVNWMCYQKFWLTGTKDDDINDTTKIDTKGDFPNSKRIDLVKYIEDGGMVGVLKKLVGKYWAQIEEEVRTPLEPKYC